LKIFVQEILRKSKTSYSTLQIALYYLILFKECLLRNDFNQQAKDKTIQYGRRMFLTALILSSKYLQDHNHSTHIWSKISGIRSSEINQNEIQYLNVINCLTCLKTLVNIKLISVYTLFLILQHNE